MIKSTLLFVILLIVLAGGSLEKEEEDGGPTAKSSCEGRMVFIELPSNKTYELRGVGYEKGNLRASSKQSYKAKSYGNCCWTLYSK